MDDQSMSIAREHFFNKILDAIEEEDDDREEELTDEDVHGSLILELFNNLDQDLKDKLVVSLTLEAIQTFYDRQYQFKVASSNVYNSATKEFEGTKKNNEKRKRILKKKKAQKKKNRRK